MANIDGMIGFNSPTGTNKLLAAYGNDIVDVSTGLGYSLNLTAGSKAYFEKFIDRVFFTNGVDFMKSFGTTWSSSIGLPKKMLPKYIKKSVNNAQLLLANVTLQVAGSNYVYRNYFFKSNFPKFIRNPAGGSLIKGLTWGYEEGTANLDATTRQLRAVRDASNELPDFKAAEIKVGDPVFMLGSSGGTAGTIGVFTVASIDGAYQLTLNEPINTDTGVDFWVGRNWVEVPLDGDDQITGLGENNSRDLIFGLFSVWYYTSSSLKQIKGAPGTNSQQSVINDNKGYTYYFHGSDIETTGIYRYDGIQSIKISRAIEPFIQGMTASNYASVAAWAEGDEIRFFLGDLTNVTENINMTKAVATLNTITGAWDVGPIADAVTAATKYTVSSVRNSYVGTDAGRVLKMNSGNDFNGTPIPAVVETGIKYPVGPELQNTYPFIQVIAKNAKGVRVSYKLWNKPVKDDDRWEALGELTSDKTEFEPKINNRIGSGIQFRFEEDGVLKNNWLIEKISIFYKPDRTRLQ